MRAPLLQWCRTGNYFLGAVLFLLIGYWIKKHLILLDNTLNNNLLIVVRDSPYLSFSIPLWCANLIAGALLFGTLLLIVPMIRVLWQRLLHFIIFCVLLFICVLPLHVHVDVTHINSQQLLYFSYRLILGSCGIALFFRGLVGIPLSHLHTSLSRFFLWVRNIHSRPFIIGMFTGCVLVCASISWHLFDGVPGFMDSCSYMFQARLFAHGMLSAPLPPEPEFFEVGNTILSDRWYTVYPPGYPAVLALGVIFKISWLVNPILGALTIVCIFLLAKELYGRTTAKLSAMLACASSFFLFMSSEFASHTSTLFFITLAFLCFVWMVQKKRPLLSAVVCGASLGIALLCRPYTTVWFCVPLGIAAIVKRKELSLRHILIGAILILVACCAFLAYNYATTGHPLLFGYIAMHGKDHYPGFHQAPWSNQAHTVAQGFKHVFSNLNALSIFLFEWPIPSLFFACIFLASGKKRFWEWLLVGWIGTLLVGQFFYFFNQLDFGPRFMYECLPALILLTSQGLSLTTQFITSQWKSLSEVHAQNILGLVLIGLFLFAFLFNVPATVKTYQYYGTDVTIKKYLDKNDVEQALVFVKGGRAYQVHYPFNAPFAKPHIYAKDRGSENKKLAEKFPGYRYFIADEEKVEEVSIDELQQTEPKSK